MEYGKKEYYNNSYEINLIAIIIEFAFLKKKKLINIMYSIY